MYWPATKFVPFYLLDADVSVHHHANLVDRKYFELYQFVVSLLDLLISANSVMLCSIQKCSKVLGNVTVSETKPFLLVAS